MCIRVCVGKKGEGNSVHVYPSLQIKSYSWLFVLYVCARLCVTVIDSSLYPYECMFLGMKTVGSLQNDLYHRSSLLLRRLIAQEDKDKSFLGRPICLPHTSTITAQPHSQRWTCCCCLVHRGKRWTEVNRAAGRELSLCGFTGRNVRQEHGLRWRKMQEDRQTQIID